MKKLFLIVILVTFGGVTFAEGFPAVEVYQKTSKAVVLIVAQKDDRSSMAGAGSFITNTGYVVTNAHVVIDKSMSRPFSQIRVYIKPDRVTGDFSQDLSNKYKARVVAFDTDLDLAVLKVDHAPGDAVIQLANSDQINVGEEVVAIGHPEQGGLWSLTYGRISGEIDNQSKIKGKNVFQTDTSVNRGNSGGPLLDRRGYMVGINTNIARLGADNLPITGVNFALRSSVVKNWLDRQGIMLAYGKLPLNDGEIQTVNVRSENRIGSAEKGATEGEQETAKEKNPKTPSKAVENSVPVEERAAAKASVEPTVKPAEPKPAQAEVKTEEERPGIVTEKEARPDAVGPVLAQEDRILTPKKPYSFDSLFREVEKEMEDMMQEMRGEIDKKKDTLDGSRNSRTRRRRR